MQAARTLLHKHHGGGMVRAEAPSKSDWFCRFCEDKGEAYRNFGHRTSCHRCHLHKGSCHAANAQGARNAWGSDKRDKIHKAEQRGRDKVDQRVSELGGKSTMQIELDKVKKELAAAKKAAGNDDSAEAAQQDGKEMAKVRKQLAELRGMLPSLPSLQPNITELEAKLQGMVQARADAQPPEKQLRHWQGLLTIRHKANSRIKDEESPDIVEEIVSLQAKLEAKKEELIEGEKKATDLHAKCMAAVEAQKSEVLATPAVPVIAVAEVASLLAACRQGGTSEGANLLAKLEEMVKSAAPPPQVPTPGSSSSGATAAQPARAATQPNVEGSELGSADVDMASDVDQIEAMFQKGCACEATKAEFLAFTKNIRTKFVKKPSKK